MVEHVAPASTLFACLRAVGRRLSIYNSEVVGSSPAPSPAHIEANLNNEHSRVFSVCGPL